MEEELDLVWKKIKSRKAASRRKYLLKYTRHGNLMIYLFIYAMLSINKIEKRKKVCILPFLKKDNLRITKNYSGITPTVITAKVYNALLLNCTKPEIEKILRKNQNSFLKN